VLLEGVIRDGKLAGKGGRIRDLIGRELRVASVASVAVAPAHLVEAVHLAAVDGGSLRGVIVGHAGDEIRRPRELDRLPRGELPLRSGIAVGTLVLDA
jgi:hypothetical protein